jgi:outer membrane protein assembly factor BamE
MPDYKDPKVSKITRFLCQRRPLALMLSLVTLVGGCSSGKWGFPYRAPIQQGNWLTQDQVALLRQGMTREQVRFALGSPTLDSVLHADRWNYPYYYKQNYSAAQQRQFSVWFENNRLVRWQGDPQPDFQPFQLTDQLTPKKQKSVQKAKTTESSQAQPTASQIELPAATPPPSPPPPTNPATDALGNIVTDPTNPPLPSPPSP